MLGPISFRMVELSSEATLLCTVNSVNKLVGHEGRDPRREFRLRESRPNVSFVLFDATVSSPPLVALSTRDDVAAALMACAQQFVRKTIAMDKAKKLIRAPEVVR